MSLRTWVTASRGASAADEEPSHEELCDGAEDDSVRGAGAGRKKGEDDEEEEQKEGEESGEDEKGESEEEEEEDDEEDEDEEDDDDEEEEEEEEDDDDEDEDEDDWETDEPTKSVPDSSAKAAAKVKPGQKQSVGASEAKAVVTPAKPQDKSREAAAPPPNPKAVAPTPKAAPAKTALKPKAAAPTPAAPTPAAPKAAAPKAAAPKAAAPKAAAPKAAAPKAAAPTPAAPKAAAPTPAAPAKAAPAKPKVAPAKAAAPQEAPAKTSDMNDDSIRFGPYWNWRGQLYAVQTSSVTLDRLVCGAPPATDKSAFGVVIDHGVPVVVSNQDTLSTLGPGAKQCLFEPGAEVDLQPVHVKVILAIGDKDAAKDHKLSKKLMFTAIGPDDSRFEGPPSPNAHMLRSVPKAVQPKLYSKFRKMAEADPNNQVLNDLLSVWPPDTASHSIAPELNECMLTRIYSNSATGRWLAKTAGYQQKAPKPAAAPAAAAPAAAAPAAAAKAAAAPAAAAKAAAKRSAGAEATTATGAPKKRAKVVQTGNYPSQLTVETLTATDNPDLDAIQAFRRDNGDWAIYYVWKA